MKRWPALLLAMLMIFTACSQNPEEAQDFEGTVTAKTQQEAPVEEEETSSEEELAAAAEAERLAAEQAEAERLAAQQAEAERLAAQQAEAERLAAQQAEAERLAAQQAEAERLAAEQAAAEKAANSQSAGMKLTGKNFLSAVEEDVLDEINAVRRAKGLSTLTYDSNLEKAARIRSKELAQYDYFAHTRPNGDDWGTVLTVDVPISHSGRGENLAMAESDEMFRHRTADEWVDQWVGSPSHYENMIRPEFTHIGVGIYYTVDDDGYYRSYATTIFAIL